MDVFIFNFDYGLCFLTCVWFVGLSFLTFVLFLSHHRVLRLGIFQKWGHLLFLVAIRSNIFFFSFCNTQKRTNGEGISSSCLINFYIFYIDTFFTVFWICAYCMKTGTVNSAKKSDFLCLDYFGNRVQCLNRIYIFIPTPSYFHAFTYNHFSIDFLPNNSWSIAIFYFVFIS